MHNSNLAEAAGRVALIAGPLFLVLLLLIAFVQSAPDPVAVSTAEAAVIMYAPILLVLSTIVGVALAFPICLIGGAALWTASRHFPLLRAHVVWAATGACAALLLLRLLDLDAVEAIEYAFVGTSMACATLVRNQVRWE